MATEVAALEVATTTTDVSAARLGHRLGLSSRQALEQSATGDETDWEKGANSSKNCEERPASCAAVFTFSVGQKQQTQKNN